MFQLSCVLIRIPSVLFQSGYRTIAQNKFWLRRISKHNLTSGVLWQFTLTQKTFYGRLKAFLWFKVLLMIKCNVYRTDSLLQTCQLLIQNLLLNQGSGSGLDPDPDWIRIQEGKITHKGRKKCEQFMFWSVGWPLWRAEGFVCNLDVLNRGLRIGKL